MYDIYDDQLPMDEQTVRHIQRQAGLIHHKVTDWASRVLALFPSHLPLSPIEAEILKLYLAQQRRLNLELDGQSGHHSFRTRVAGVLPFPTTTNNPEIAHASHQLACSYLQHQVEDTTDRFCGRQGVSPASQAVIDWRGTIRYLAQRLHHIAHRMNLNNSGHLGSPLKFELALLAHQGAADVAHKRRFLLEGAKTAVS